MTATDTSGKGSKERTLTERKELLDHETGRDQVSALFRVTGNYGLQKLKTIRGYLWSYSVIMAKRFPGQFAYVDGMSGPGFLEIGKKRPKGQMRLDVPDAGQFALGSPMLALSNHPHYPRMHLIEANRPAFKALEARASHYYPERATVERGDCNKRVPLAAQELTNAKAFFFLDPEGLEVDFVTIRSLKSACKGAELFILYPYDMAVRRCLEHKQSESRLDRFFGTAEWREIRDEVRSEVLDAESARRAFLGLYLSEIRRCGFRETFPSDVIRSDSDRDLYFLLFAGDNPTGLKIMRDVQTRVGTLRAAGT